MKLFRWLRRVASRRRGGASAVAGGEAGLGLSLHEITLRDLHNILQSDEGAFAIELRLGAYKRRFGLHWPDHWPEVDRVVHETIAARAGACGQYAFAGEAYIFLFRGIGRDDAREAVSVISEAIGRYASDYERASIAPSSGDLGDPASAIEVHPDGDEDGGRPVQQTVGGGSARSGAAAAPRTAGVRPPQRPAGVPSAAATRAGEAAMSIISQPAAAGAGRQGAREPVSKSHRRLISGLETAIMDATARQDWEVRKHSQARAFPPPGLTFVYRPMWNPRTGMLSTYRIFPALARSPIAFDLGDTVLPQRVRREDEQHLDHLVLGRVAYDLIISRLQPPRPFVCVPLHMSTLSTAEARSTYLEVCSQIPNALSRYVLFEVQDANKLAGPGQLLAWRRELSRFGSAVMGQVPVETPDFVVWREVGLRAVGCDMRDSQLSEAEAIVRFNDFVTRAREQHLKTFVRGLSTMSLTIGALGAGFDFVEGDAVRNTLPNEAAGVEQFALEKLYSAA